MVSSNFHFGPEILEKGVRFNLWAPDAATVEIVIDSNPPLAMEKNGQGFYQLTSADAKVGSQYKFLIDGKTLVPDPASRFQPHGVSGASEVLDLKTLPKDRFAGRPWAESVIYELHVGTFSPEGTYAGLEKKLDYLKDLGVTAVELMPVNDIPGTRNWGYDGVLLNAPTPIYGRPEDLVHLVNATHARGMMIYLDVVYNHMGPEGNYLSLYAKEFFNEKHKTDWGAAINLDNENAKFVRRFLIDNALQWVRDYGFDGLRFDAVHALKDDSGKHFLYEMAEEIRAQVPDRPIHLMLENAKNESRYLERVDARTPHFDAQWSDDIHHAIHVLATGETDSYYAAFADRPLHHLGRSLTEGFAYQGEIMFPSTDDKDRRGEPSAHLPPEATIAFAQNHDQIGNRLLGERLSQMVGEDKLRQIMALVALNPHIPLLFMGEEAAVKSPFLFFCDWTGKVAEATRIGRGFVSQNPVTEKQQPIPDPIAIESMHKSQLNWDEIAQPQNQAFHNLTRELLHLRQEHVVPMIKDGFKKAGVEIFGRAPEAQDAIYLYWQTAKEALQIISNFSDVSVPMPALLESKVLWDSHADKDGDRLEPQRIIVRKGRVSPLSLGKNQP